jgi:predicted enzyme related to lactoylglutathione lyase
MFEYDRAVSGLAAPDLSDLKDFYGGVLGLEVREEMDGYVLMIAFPDGREILAYVKPDHEPSNATALHFFVADIDKAVDALTAKGATFERYDGFDQDEKGISRTDQGPPNAWFKDPAGNLLALVEAD